MAKRCINPPELVTPVAPYSWATVAHGVVFIGGLIALDKTGRIVGEGDVVRQTEQVLEHMRTTIAAAGGSMADIMKTTVYLTDAKNFKAMNEVYGRYFPSNPPTRATLITGMALEGLLVEIEGFAVLDDHS